MLSLTRNPGETITITDTVTGETIVVAQKTATNSTKTRISIQASPRFRIMRTELLTKDPEPVIAPKQPPMPLVNSSWVRDLHEAKRKKR